MRCSTALSWQGRRLSALPLHPSRSGAHPASSQTAPLKRAAVSSLVRVLAPDTRHSGEPPSSPETLMANGCPFDRQSGEPSCCPRSPHDQPSAVWSPSGAFAPLNPRPAFRRWSTFAAIRLHAKPSGHVLSLADEIWIRSPEAMTDTRTPEQRRRIMQSVKTADTEPEWSVRRLLFSLGYRYRLHRKDLPGCPDIVLPSRRKAIFVHGCFWHGHSCSKGRAPKSRKDYWGPKIAANRERDARNLCKLNHLGWATAVVWQCELADREALTSRLKSFVEDKTNRGDKT